MTLLRGDDPAAVAKAAHCLADGGLVAFPTETVYGLGARADRDDAVQAIFDAKGRPADHPLIVHVAAAAAALEFARSLDGPAQRLVDAFWPGPVTVIVARRADRALRAAGALPTIALRCPAHPVARALLARCAELGVAGVAAPSANRFGRVSPTRAEHVADEFGPDLLVLDGGACPLGIESTIVDCSQDDPVLLRPGTLARSSIEQVLGRPLAAPDAGSARAPGTLARHYAPRTRLRLVDRAALAAALADATQTGCRMTVYSRERPAPVADTDDEVRWRQMPSDPAAAAHELFAVLRDLDRCGADQIWVELPPDEPAWDGVRDRLRRAAAS